MPFITQERRKLIDNGSLPREDWEPGDLCYHYYRAMVRDWKLTPRWTTAHHIYQNVLSHNFTVEDAAAIQLAYKVFFNLYVMPYELKKRAENGDVG